MLKDWQRYEQLAREIIERLKQHFELARIEEKQKILGSSGTYWEIDAKGVTLSGDTVVIECRLTKASQSQANLAALAFTIQDTRSVRGIIVTPCDLQEGAKKVAMNANVESMILNPSSTPSDFAAKVLGKLFLGVPSFETGKMGAPSVGNA